MKTAFIISAALLLLYFSFNYAIEHVLAYSPIRPMKCTADSFLTPSVANLKWDHFDITIEDSIKLKGWYIYSSADSAKGTIFLLHGIANCKAGMLCTAQFLSDEGYNCVLYDSRANGESGGQNCTFGFYEKYDLSAYLDSTITRYPGSGPYGILGHSMGGAVTVQALAHDKRLACGVVMSTFADLKEIIRDYFANSFVRLNYIPDKALMYTESIAAFKTDSVRPVIAAREIKQPVLVIHGTKDKNISARYGRQVYDNLKSNNKEWYEIKNAQHNNIPATGGEEWKRKIILFFNNHLRYK